MYVNASSQCDALWYRIIPWTTTVQNYHRRGTERTVERSIKRTRNPQNRESPKQRKSSQRKLFRRWRFVISLRTQDSKCRLRISRLSSFMLQAPEHWPAELLQHYPLRHTLRVRDQDYEWLEASLRQCHNADSNSDDDDWQLVFWY